MIGTNDGDEELRRELAGWFADHARTEHAREDSWRDVVETALAKTAVTPQRRPLMRWIPGMLPRAAGARPIALFLGVAVLLAAGVGFELLGGQTARLSAPPAVPGLGPASPAPSTFPPGPHLYWANSGLSTIGAATVDGGWSQENLIRGAHFPCGVAVDASYVYWANAQDGSIGRANLDGTGVDQRFITGATSPCGVAVDASHIYWANGGAAAVAGPSVDQPQALLRGTDATTIGRANLDGTGVDQRFITGASDPCGIAVDSQHVYWANSGTYGAGHAGATIGRANLDGSGVEQRLIAGARTSWSCGIAVDSAHIYWASGTYTIGRANVGGTGATSAWVTTARDPCGIAVDQGHLYWASNTLLGIARADLDGSGVDPYFLWIGNALGFPYTCGVAIGP